MRTIPASSPEVSKRNLWATIALLTLLAPVLHAEPEVQFSTDHTQIAPGIGAHVFIENRSEETLTNVMVQWQLSPGLAFDGDPVSVGEDWTCARAGNTYTCTVPAFEAGRADGFSFVLSTSSSTGGHRTVAVTLSASNLTPRSITFDVITTSLYQVTTSGDFGPGSLRAAIDAVNENPLCGTDVPCTISFSHNMTIAPFTPLPAIRKCNVNLRGPDFLFTKGITISGENATHGNGIEVRAGCNVEDVGGVTIAGLAIHSWPWNGIYFEAPGPSRYGHLVSNCHIGTDDTGFVARPNRSRGIVTDSPHEIISVFQSIVSGNGRSGIALFRGKQAFLGSLKIGTDVHLQPLGNGASGVFTNGVPLILGSSTIAFNAHAGVSGTPARSQSYIAGASLRENGGLPIDWGLDGRTPPDDETDGILNAPRITEATYNATAGMTVIRGVVRLRKGTPEWIYGIEPYWAVNAKGDVLDRIPTFPQFVQPPADGSVGDVPFELVLPSDLRGTFVAVQAYAGPPPLASLGITSEISEGALVQ